MKPCTSTPSCSNVKWRSFSTPSSAATRRGEVGLAVRRDEAANQLVLELRHDRRGEVDLLEERMHGAADLGSRHLAGPLALHGPLTHPEPVAGEVLVRALLEQRERREREPAHAVERRVRQRH